MLGLATGTELRLAAYGVLLAAIGGWLLWHDHEEIAKGETRIKAQDASARAAQKALDAKVSQGVVDDLKAKLTELNVREPPARPAPTLRLCVPARYVSKGPAPSGTEPAVASSPGAGPGGMSQGAPGVDIGPAVSDLERATEVVALYRNELWNWSVKQGETK